MGSDSGASCTLAGIRNFSQYNYLNQCEYVKDVCADQTSEVDFFSFYYCNINQSVPLFVPFGIVLVLLIFYFISSTAEDYLEPAVAKIAKIFRFSESLAGVTLVALANGAPDVIAAFAAGGNANEGVLVPLGGLLGAGIFTFTIILGVCILVSKTKMVKTEKEAVKRDCIFYLIGTIYVFALGIFGEINLLASIGFFIQYAVFICVVLYQEAQYRKRQVSQQEVSPIKGPSFIIEYAEEDPKTKFDLLDSLIKEDHLKHHEVQTKILDADLSEGEIVINRDHSSLDKLDRVNNLSAPRLRWKYYLIKHKIWQEFEEIAEKRWLGKVFHIILYPVKVARDLTIPACYSEQWSKIKSMIQPFTVTLFLIWQFNYFYLLGTPAGLVIYFLVCSLLSFSIWKVTHVHQVPEGFLGYLLMLIAFTSSVVWINLVATILVDFIALLSVFTSLPLNFLGLTLVAFGGSTPDFFIDLTLAKKGLGQTALSGIFAGQYFNVGIGFGVSLTRQVVTYGPKPFNLISTSRTAIINLVLLGCLLLSVIVTMIYGWKNHYVFKKGLAIFCLGLYIVFLTSVTILSL